MRKRKKSTYERVMLACINTLPFTFHSPGKPNIKKLRRMDVPMREQATDRIPNKRGQFVKNYTKIVDVQETKDRAN